MPSLAQRAAKRAEAAERRRIARIEAERRAEQKAERLAPAIQRHDVRAPDGTVIRAARLERSGAGFIRANPLAVMEANTAFRAQHLAAAKRLIAAWDAVGGGVGLGGSNWGGSTGGGSVPGIPTGYCSLLAQIGQRREIEGAAAWCGALWPCLKGVVLDGMSLSAWAQKACVNRAVVTGYLLASLDRLVEFYKAIEPKVRASPSSGIRSAEIAA